MHCSTSRFFVFYAEQKISLTWPDMERLMGWKVWMKYADVYTSWFAEENLINFVADIQWLLDGFISYLKGDGQPYCTEEKKTVCCMVLSQ